MKVSTITRAILKVCSFSIKLICSKHVGFMVSPIFKFTNIFLKITVLALSTRQRSFQKSIILKERCSFPKIKSSTFSLGGKK